MCLFFQAIGTVVLTAALTTASANNLGVRGAIYPIAEPDMLSQIEARLIDLAKTGELAQHQKALAARVKAHILRPPPVKGISDLPPGKTAVSRPFDPSRVLASDIRGPRGVLIALAGTRINPLDAQRFGEVLVFANGDNAKQLAWLKQTGGKLSPNDPRPVKLIWVKGDIEKGQKALGKRVYFDQAGHLCHRFGIHYTPTRVFQPKTAEHTLQVEEVALD